MHVTFIKPNIGRREHSLYVDEARMEPLMLGVLAGLTPPDVDVALHDDRMESIPYDAPTDLAAITVETYTARRSYEIAEEYRKRGVPVILGGMHVTLLPDECEPHADSLFLGDAETLWTQVIRDVENGRLQKRYDGPPGVAQIGGVMPRREIFQGKGYLPMALMQYSRGCHFACSFCAVSQYFEKKHCWFSQASLDLTRDSQIMKLMADSGNVGNVTGFESITHASLKESKKSPNIGQFTNYQREIRILREYGMQTWAAFTLGYDHDTYDSILATMDFALENRFTFAAFNILMPYPNTPLYRKLDEQGRLLFDGKWWLHPEYRFNQAAFTPVQLSADKLTEACHGARKEFNKFSSLIYRFSDIKTNLKTLWSVAAYWRYTTLFRKEVYKKHGMRFGLH